MGALSSLASLAVLSLPNGYVKPQRQIGGIIPNVVVEEFHEDNMEITQHPVEKSAAISDHAYKLPASVRITCGFSPSGSGSAPGPVGAAIAGLSALASTFQPAQPSGLTDIYNQFLTYQRNAVLLTVVTGKRQYENMLVRSLAVDTDRDTENALIVMAVLQEIPLAETSSVSVPDNSSMQFPQQTGSVLNVGPQQAAASPPNYNAAGSP